MNQLKIVIIGAGSSYTPEFIEGIIKRYHELKVTSLYLVDIEEGLEKLNIIYNLAKRMLDKANIKIELVKTLDIDMALKDADFVATQIRVGFLKAREYDEGIPLSHGVLGQETNGAGGFFKALRTIPVLMNIADKMHQLCPNAWLINFTNPAGIVTEALLKHSKHDKIVGVCNVPISLENQFIKQMNLDRNKTSFRFIGLNHNVFVSDIIVNEKSILPEAINHFVNHVDDSVANVDRVIWDESFIKALNAIPCPYHRYYFKYDELLASSLKKYDANNTRAQQVARVEKELFKEYAKEDLDHKPEALSKRGGAYYSDVACNLISSIYNNKNDIQTLNIRNNGTVPFLDADCVIECSCYVGENGFKALDKLVIPFMAQGLIYDLKNFEKMCIEVALTGNKDLAIAALTTNRLVNNDQKAHIIFDELYKVHKKYLPQFKEN